MRLGTEGQGILQQQAITHDPRAAATPSQAKWADERLARLARISGAALRAPVPHKPTGPIKIEITETAVETPIEVVACNGQIVIISGSHVAEARAVFERMTKFGPGFKVTVARIQGAVCQALNISRIDLMSRRRTAQVARARQIAMYLAKTLTLKSLPEIGHLFDKDHTTVLHNVRKIALLAQTDEQMRGDIEAICAALGCEVA